MAQKSRFQLSEILKSIIVAGIIEICGLCMVISMSLFLQFKYNNIIEKGYTITEKISTIIVNEFTLQNIVYEHYTQKNSYENYKSEAEENIESTKDCIQYLKENMKESSDKIEFLSCDYTLYSSYVMATFTNAYTYDDLSTQIHVKGNNVVNICNSLQYNNDNQIRIQAKQIEQYIILLIYMYVLIIAVIVISIIFSIRSAKKNGYLMLREQEKSDIKAKEAKQEAYTDNLTGLWNRKYLEKKINRAIAENESGWLFMMDMDNFKAINDTYGHIAGDNILKAFAEALRDSTRSCDICCRAGGDEFMLFAQNINRSQVESLYRRIVYNSAQMFGKIEGGEIVTISMGVQMLCYDMTYQEIYDEADEALYKIKKNGKAGIYIN